MTLQIVPFARGGHAAAGGSFSILRFEERHLPDVVYIEQLTSAPYLEHRSDAEHYLDVMEQLSGEALSPAGATRFIEQVARGDMKGALAPRQGAQLRSHRHGPRWRAF